MTHYATISADRCCDYTGPRYTYSAVAEMPKRCDVPHCREWSEADCASCGAPLCDEHAFRCEECGSAEGKWYCGTCTVLVDGGIRDCHRHAMAIPASEGEI